MMSYRSQVILLVDRSPEGIGKSRPNLQIPYLR